MNTSKHDINQDPSINYTELDTPTQIAIEALYGVAKETGIKDGKWSSYQLALTQNIMTMMDLDLERRDLEELSYTIEKRKIAAENELKNMRALLGNMRSHRDEKELPKVEYWQEQTSILKQKIEEDTLRLEKLTKETSNKMNITVTDIVQLENQVHKMEKRLDETKRQLNQYNDLPCDMDQATKKAQEKIDLYNELENERERLLASISHSMHR